MLYAVKISQNGNVGALHEYNRLLEPISCHKYLGVYIQDKLTKNQLPQLYIKTIWLYWHSSSVVRVIHPRSLSEGSDCNLVPRAFPSKNGKSPGDEVVVIGYTECRIIFQDSFL